MNSNSLGAITKCTCPSCGASIFVEVNVTAPEVVGVLTEDEAKKTIAENRTIGEDTESALGRLNEE